jgi:hypothetical protein
MISLLKEANSAVNDVKNGYPLQYRVDFPLRSPLPKPTAIILNDRQLCSGPQGEIFYGIKSISNKSFLEIGQDVTTIKLHNTFETNLNSRVLPPDTQLPVTYQTQPPVIYQTQPPQYQTPPPPRPIYQTTTQRITFPVQSNYFQCGVRYYQKPSTTGLVINGLLAKRGQFPW